jgi:hypothetical protein
VYMSRSNNNQHSYRQPTSVGEAALDVGHRIADIIESRQRRSHRGYAIVGAFAVITLIVSGFLAGIVFKDRNPPKQSAEPCHNLSTAPPTPSPQVNHSAGREPEAPESNVEAKPDDSPLTPTSSLVHPIADNSKKYNSTGEQFAARPSAASAITTAWYPEERYGARKRSASPVITAAWAPVIKETKKRRPPEAALEWPGPVATRPRRVNAKKGEYQLR